MTKVYLVRFGPGGMLTVAQAIEARQRQDAKTGLARKGESAVGKADAPTL